MALPNACCLDTKEMRSSCGSSLPPGKRMLRSAHKGTHGRESNAFIVAASVQFGQPAVLEASAGVHEDPKQISLRDLKIE